MKRVNKYYPDSRLLFTLFLRKQNKFIHAFLRPGINSFLFTAVAAPALQCLLCSAQMMAVPVLRDLFSGCVCPCASGGWKIPINLGLNSPIFVRFGFPKVLSALSSENQGLQLTKSSGGLQQPGVLLWHRHPQCFLLPASVLTLCSKGGKPPHIGKNKIKLCHQMFYV